MSSRGEEGVGGRYTGVREACVVRLSALGLVPEAEDGVAWVKSAVHAVYAVRGV